MAMQHHRLGASISYRCLKHIRYDLLGDQSGTLSALNSEFVRRSCSGLTSQHHSHLKASSSNRVTCDGLQNILPFAVPLGVNKICISHDNCRSLPFPANDFPTTSHRFHISSLARRQASLDRLQIPVELFEVVKELNAGTNEFTGACEVNDFVKEKLCTLPEGISPGVLQQIVLHTCPSVRLLMAITRWAIRQPDWYHSFWTYARVVLYMSEQNNYANVRECIKEIMGVALSSRCTLYRSLVTPVGLRLNRIGLPESTVQLVKAMEEQGVVPETTVYGIHMSALTKLKDLPGAVELLKKMEEAKAGPDSFHYNVFLRLCGEMRNKVLLEQTIQTMVRRRIQPDVYTCSILIQAYGLLGEPGTAMAVADEMRELGVRFNFQIYGALFNAQIKNNNLKEAKKVYMDALSNNKLPRDAEYYKLLLLWHSNPLNAEKLLESHQEMIDAGFRQPASVYNKLVFRLKHAGEVERSLKLLQTMQLSGSRPLRPELYDDVVSKIAKKGQSRETGDGEETSFVATMPPRFNFAGNLGRCMQAIAVRDLPRLSEIIADFRTEERDIHPALYLCLLLLWRKSSSDIERSSLMIILDSCNVEVHEVVKLLLDETQAEDDIWPEVQDMLQRFFTVWKGLPAHFFNCIIGLLCANNLHSRAARLWEASRVLLLTVPEISGLKVVKGAYKLDLHTCSVSTGKVITCVELRRVNKVADAANLMAVYVVTGKGNRSRVVGQSRLKEGIESMLQRMGSPFRIPYGNSGCFYSSVGDVKEWLRQPGVMYALRGHADEYVWET